MAVKLPGQFATSHQLDKLAKDEIAKNRNLSPSLSPPPRHQQAGKVRDSLGVGIWVRSGSYQNKHQEEQGVDTHLAGKNFSGIEKKYV